MRICISQLNPTIGAIGANTQKIIHEIALAKKEKATLIIFPEMAIPGYMPDDLLLYTPFIDRIEQALNEIITHTTSIAVIVGLPRRSENILNKALCNSAAVIMNGKLLGFQDKALLPTYDVFDERRYFRPAPQEKIWEIGGKRIGITICEDIWPNSGVAGQEHYPVDPLAVFEKEKPDLLINISASPYSEGKIETRKEVAKACVKRLHCPMILCNQVGGQDGLLFDGTSVVFSKEGELLQQAMSFAQDHLLFDLDQSTPITPVTEKGAPELFYALVMGLHDYFVKQGFTKAVLGLSGGIDSSLVACIAVQALGKENVLGVLLPSRYTSTQSTEDALAVASNLSVNTMEVSIENPYQALLDNLHSLFNGQDHGVVAENIQARVRGTLLMAISNKEGYLLLNTSNKSELAMGYTTLYGDSCGSISVIGDLLKCQVYDIANWVMKTTGWIPPRILEKEPTAELRHNQKDSDTLPEYSILDPIIEASVVEMKSAEDIATQLSLPLPFVLDIIQKIHAAEYKRRQCPFQLRVSDKAFSVGRRVPIVEKSLFSTPPGAYFRAIQ